VKRTLGRSAIHDIAKGTSSVDKFADMFPMAKTVARSVFGGGGHYYGGGQYRNYVYGGGGALLLILMISRVTGYMFATDHLTAVFRRTDKHRITNATEPQTRRNLGNASGRRADGVCDVVPHLVGIEFQTSVGVVHFNR